VYIRQSSNALVILALVLGLVLGATAVGMIWFLSGHTRAAAVDTPTEASRDAQAACALLVKVPLPSVPDFTGQGGYQLAGAASLADAATTADPHYRPLSDALTEANAAVGQYPAGQRASDALANARAACAEL
jgi:hypothetical protein